MDNAKVTVYRDNGKEWCSLEVRLENGRLSICGSAGDILSRAKARREALSYWEGFFEENAEERVRALTEWGKPDSRECSETKYSLCRLALIPEGDPKDLSDYELASAEDEPLLVMETEDEGALLAALGLSPDVVTIADEETKTIEEVSLEEFLHDNEEDDDVVEKTRALKDGEMVAFGGGAQPFTVIKRKAVRL